MDVEKDCEWGVSVIQRIIRTGKRYLLQGEEDEEGRERGKEGEERLDKHKFCLKKKHCSRDATPSTVYDL